jgi:hypothetical protein
MNAVGPGQESPRLPIDRRTFIGALLALFAAGRPSAARPVEQGNGSDAPSPSVLVGFLTDHQAATRLGRAYLAAHPGEQSQQRLMAQLSAALAEGDTPLPFNATTDQAAEALQALVLSEYRTGSLQTVGGWLLAPSEARLYGLAALLAQAR